MDTLVFLPKEKQNKTSLNAINLVFQVLTAAFLSASTVAIAVSMFGLRYSAENAFNGSLLGGLISVWNRIADTFGSTNFELITKYVADEGEEGLLISLFLILLTAAAFMLIRSRFSLGVLMFVIPIAILSVVFRFNAPSEYFLLFGISVILSIIVMKNDKGFLAGIGTVIPISIILGLLLLGLNLNELDKRPKRVQTTGDGFVASIADLFYGRDPLGHGDLRIGERNSGEGVALKITMSNPQSLYLKGYIGSHFDGRSWSQLSNSSYYDAEPRMEALRRNSFSPITQISDVAHQTYEDVKNTSIKIEVQDADSRYAFIPYELSDLGSLGNTSIKGGDLLNHGRYQRFKDYEFTALENQTDNWTDEAARLFTMALGSLKDKEKGASDDGITVSDYMELESHFNEYVYDNYTYVSVGEMQTLADFIGEPFDISEGHLDYKVAISSIRKYLEDNFIYTEKVGAETSESGNLLRKFFESGKGFDVHYATAATIMFRYYGIPARYVEGYLVTPEAVEDVKDGETLEVGFDKAHAWTEIYIDGLGFVPLEVTPEFYGVMNEADMDVGISNNSLMSEFQEAFGGKPLGAPDEDTDSAKELKDGGNNALQLLIKIVVLAFALAIIAFILRRLIPILLLWLGERKLMKRFKEEPAKPASAAIYGYMEKRNLPISPRAAEIGNLAAYSQEDFDERLRKAMLRELRKAKEMMKNSSKVNKKRGLKPKKLAASISGLLVIVMALSLTLTACNKGAVNDINNDVDLDAVRAETVARVVSNSDNPAISSVGGDWAVYAVAKSEVDVNEDYYNLYWDNVRTEIKRGKGEIDSEYYSDYARVCLGLSAIGNNARDVEGYDLTPFLDEYEAFSEQGITASGFALIAAGAQGVTLDNEEKYLSFILEELNSGSFYGKSDMTDYVSMSLQALARYKDREEVSNTIDACINSLSEAQLEDGSLGNCESTVECIIALTELGINPLTDERFIKDGKNLLDGLMVYYLGDGNFMHANPQSYPDINEPDQMSTEKALLALDALYLNEKGESLYS